MQKILYIVTSNSHKTETDILLTLLDNYDKSKWSINVAVPARCHIIPYLQKANAEYVEYLTDDVSEFKNLLMTKKPDVIHTSKFKPALIAAKKLKMPVVCTETGTADENKKGLALLKEKWFNFRTINKLILFNDKLIPEANVPKKIISVINPGVAQIEKYSTDKVSKMKKFYGLDDNNFALVTFAAMNDLGGHNCLLEAAFCLKESHPNIRIYICGKGNEAMNIKDKIKIMKLNETVLFLGDVRDTASILNVADALIDASEQEKNFDFKVLESLSVGLPCILSDKFTGELGAGELYFTARNARMLAEKILLVADNKEMREKMHRDALETFNSRFSGKLMAMHIEEVYMSVIK